MLLAPHDRLAPWTN